MLSLWFKTDVQWSVDLTKLSLELEIGLFSLLDPFNVIDLIEIA